MRSDRTRGLAEGAVAALVWSPHFYFVQRALEGGGSVLTLQLHIVFWAAAACLFALFMTGRLGELSALRRYDTVLIVLVLTGGYGFWLLRAMAIERAGAGLPYVHGLFYAGPLLMGLLALWGRQGPSGRQVFALVAGLAGCLVIAVSSRQGYDEAPGLPGLVAILLALGAAGCWAVFGLAARPIVSQEKVLPVLTVVLSAGAVCLLATCISTGESLLPASAGALWASMLLGALTVCIALGSWLKCLSVASPVTVAPLWHLGLVFGIPLVWRLAGRSPSLWALAGAAVILVAIHSSFKKHRRPDLSISDLIRG